MESEEVTTFGTCEQDVLSVFTKGHAGVVSHDGASVDQVVAGLASCWVKLPQSHLAFASNRKLIIGSVSAFVVFRITAPGEAPRSFTECRRNQSERANDMAIGGVPDEELSVESVSTTEEKSIVVGE